jgi:ribulose-5-phosphate 4-epimerase/fuculose-1-phosphate aldolase
MNHKQEIVTYAKLFEEKGFVNAMEGNLSILDREAGLLYITPSAQRKLFLAEDMICTMDRNGKQVDGKFPRSSEYLLHEYVLNARPDCNAAIHCHAPYLTAYAYCNKRIEMTCSEEFTWCFKEIPVQPYGMGGTEEIFNGLDCLVKTHNVVLLANHGVICVAKNMAECARLLESAEATVKIYSIARQIGEPYPLPADLYQLIYNIREEDNEAESAHPTV